MIYPFWFNLEATISAQFRILPFELVGINYFLSLGARKLLVDASIDRVYFVVNLFGRLLPVESYCRLYLAAPLMFEQSVRLCELRAKYSNYRYHNHLTHQLWRG